MSAGSTASSTEAHGALHKMSVRSIFSYMLGDFGCNLAFALANTWLLFYYTDVAGISAAAIGTMFLLVRLFDAFTDLVAGRAVDATMTRWGKFRPFIIFFALPLLFLSYLTFHVPHSLKVTGTNTNEGPALLYAYITYMMLGLLYSMVNIPYGSLASAMTQSVAELAKLVAWRMWGSAAAGVFLTYLIAPRISDVQKKITAAKKAGDTVQLAALQSDMQTIFTQTTLGFMVLGFACFLMVFFNCKEQVVRVQAKTTIKETIDTLRLNKPLQILCLSSLFYLTGVYAVGPATAYYARYILGDVSWTAPITLVNAGIALFFSPMGAAVLALIFLAIRGVGASIINVAMFGLEADTVEYGEWKNGTRTEGSTYAIYSFTRKLTQSLGGAISGWLLAWGSYKAGADIQPESALTAIRAAIALVPAVVAICAMLVFWKYPLNDDFFRRIRNETESRKAQRGHLIGPGGTVVDAPLD
ncbi:MFS transporter [Arsenicicoccus piscis]|uniref:Glucuronide transporter n=2 Tax=Arsenicicoccus piscis TaxID=673954 RepID=A0ABQ6HJV6_9MICO|nr:MFS transporter [Arsenicicoccus piscis]MCH8627273.1 MFS transporter [Arsenicicoccus piscis]GMA18741.1 glucuronide transporter [Arsenicicoccus piscis]